jgi:hypothetical protein
MANSTPRFLRKDHTSTLPLTQVSRLDPVISTPTPVGDVADAAGTACPTGLEAGLLLLVIPAPNLIQGRKHAVPWSLLLELLLLSAIAGCRLLAALLLLSGSRSGASHGSNLLPVLLLLRHGVVGGCSLLLLLTSWNNSRGDSNLRPSLQLLLGGRCDGAGCRAVQRDRCGSSAVIDASILVGALSVDSRC